MFVLFSVMFGRSVGSSSGEAARRLRCSPVDERSSDSENRKAYRTNSGSVADHLPLSLPPPLSVIAELLFLSVIVSPFFCHCLSLFLSLPGLTRQSKKSPGRATFARG